MRVIITFLTFVILSFGSAAQNTADNTLSRSLTNIPDNFDLQRYHALSQRIIFTDMFAGLTRLNERNEIVPAVAERWEISKDQKTYLFFLRPDSKWQDKTPVTAQDFVLSFKRLQSLDAEAFQQPLYRDIIGISKPNADLGVKALDDYTLEIRLQQPFRHFLRVLSRPAAFPIPSHIYQTYGEEWALPDNIISNGAYILIKHIPGQQITLSKNEVFFDNSNVNIPYVRYEHLRVRDNALRTVLSDSIDVSYLLDQRQLAIAKQLTAHKLYSRERTHLSFLQLNFNTPELQDLEVRRALYLAADSAKIIEMAGFDHIANRSLMPPIQDYKSVLQKPHVTKEVLKEAQELMRRAGYSPENRLQLKIRSRSHQGKVFAISLRRQFKDIYVDAIIETISGLQSHMPNNEDFGAIIRSWTIGYPDPEYFLRLFVNEHNRISPEKYQFEMESWFHRARMNDNRFNEIIGEIEMAIMESHPAVPLFSNREHIVVSNRIQNWSAIMGVDNQTQWLKITPP